MGGGGGGSEKRSATESKNHCPPGFWVIQSVTKNHFGNKLCKSIVGYADSIKCFCDKCISHSGLWTSIGDLINTVFHIWIAYRGQQKYWTGMSVYFVKFRLFIRIGAYKHDLVLEYETFYLKPTLIIWIHTDCVFTACRRNHVSWFFSKSLFGMARNGFCLKTK